MHCHSNLDYDSQFLSKNQFTSWNSISFYVEKVTRWTSCYSDATTWLLNDVPGVIFWVRCRFRISDIIWTWGHFEASRAKVQELSNDANKMLIVQELQEEVTVIIFRFFFLLTVTKRITTDELRLTGRHVYICLPLCISPYRRLPTSRSGCEGRVMCSQANDLQQQ